MTKEGENMKGNSSKFLALLLSASMMMSPAASVLADTQENAAQTESSTAVQEAPQNEETTETTETAELETTPAENAAESVTETPAEEPKEEEKEETETPAATPSADEKTSEDTENSSWFA